MSASVEQVDGNDGELLLLSEVCETYRVKYSTLQGWIKDELFGPPGQLPTKLNKGRYSQAFGRKQVEQLERFLRYREWFTCLSEYDRVPLLTEVLWQLENGEHEDVIKWLTTIEQTLDDALGQVRTEIQSLHAQYYGDKVIQPEEDS